MTLLRIRGTKATPKGSTRPAWAVRPNLVGLEDRTAPAVARWVGDVDNKWGTIVLTANPTPPPATLANTNWFNVTTGTDNYLPVSGDDLVFDDSAVGNFTNVNDSAALLTVNTILISQAGAKPAYDISAAAPATKLTLTGPGFSVAASGTTGPTWRIPLALGAKAEIAITKENPATFTGDIDLGANDLTVNTAAGDATISGKLSGTGQLIKDGTKVLLISGTAANTATGPTVINDGTVRVNKGGAVGLAGNVQVGDVVGAAKSATLLIESSDAIADTSNVTVNADGFLTFAAGVNDKVASLTVAPGGAVDTGTGTLIVTGTATFLGTAGDDTFALSGDGTVTVNGTAAGKISGPVAIDGSTGNDKLVGPDAATTFTVTGANAGTAGAAVSFKGVENLTGGSKDDVFVIGDAKAITGTIDGGGGTNTLDYSGSLTGVAVNLGANSASLVATVIEQGQEVPPTGSAATGTATVTNFNPVTNKFDLTVSVSGLDPAQVNGFHIHRAPVGVNGPIIVDLFGDPSKLVADPATGGFKFTATGLQLPPEHQAAFLGGITYVNVHSKTFPTGEIRGQLIPAAVFAAVPGVATGTAGIANISRVIGSAQADSIVGDKNVNTLAGGGGNDTIVGAQGNDVVQGGDGDDVMVWSNGDNTDVMDGQGGKDLVQVNGAVDKGDVFTVTANGTRVAFERTNLVGFKIDIGTTETLVVNGVGGDDTTTAGNLTGVADLTTLRLTGWDGSDTFNVTPSGATAVEVSGGPPSGVTPGDTLNLTLGGATVAGTTGTKGTTGQTGQVTFTDRATVSFAGIETLNGATLPAGGGILNLPFAVGPDEGDGTTVLRVGLDGKQQGTVSAFEGDFSGGVRVAVADVNGDGTGDTIVGTGPGRVTGVRVLDGKTNAVIIAIQPFEAQFTGGVFVTAADMNGDGKAEVIVSPDRGGGPRVRLFSGADAAAGKEVTLADYFGIVDPAFRGGARAYPGDVNADGTPDLAVAAGFLGGPRVSVWNGKTLLGGATPTTLFNDFFVFEQTLRNGVYVAIADVNRDGFGDVVAGGGPGGGPRVFAVSGKDLVTAGPANLVQVANFFGGDPANRGGIRLATRDIDGDGFGDIITGSGTGGGSRVTAYASKTIPAQGDPPAAFSFDAFPGFTGGVFVG